MRVQNLATECDGGRRSEGKISRKEFTSRSVHSICMVPMLNSVVTLREKSTRTELSYSRYSRHVIAAGNGLLNFSSILILTFPGVGRMALQGAPVGCEIKE